MIDKWYRKACHNWPQILDESVRTYGDKELFVYRNERISYAEFDQLTTDLANGLVKLGVRERDVVGVWMTNCLEWVIIQFAIYKAGAILLPLYSYYRKPELEYAIKQVGVSTLIMSDRFVGKIDALQILTELIPEVSSAGKADFSCALFPSLQRLIVVDATVELPSRYSYPEIMALGRETDGELELRRRQGRISPFDVMNIMYTSGTTGFPKGGMSMHVTNLSTVTHWSILAELSSDDVILCHVPLFTNLGALYASCLGIYNGCKVVITEQFDAGDSLRLIEKERVTYVPGTPSVFRLLLDHQDISRYDLSSVRGGHVAGAPLTEAGMTEIMSILGCRDVMQAWGLSECGGLSTVTCRTDTLEQRLKSVGKPLPSARVMVVDPETGTESPTGQVGEIYLGDVYPGSCVGAGYHGMPDKTEKAITSDGWFRTGDIGSFDHDGYLYLSGRVDDMFTVGGFNVYPAEIENQLSQIEGISEAWVVSMADRRLGRVPVAWVSLERASTLTEAEIIGCCKELMTSQKVPRRVIFYGLGELPMTPGGKIRKKELTIRTDALFAPIADQA